MAALSLLLVITVGIVLGVGLVVMLRAAVGQPLAPPAPVVLPPPPEPRRLPSGGRWRASHRADDADGCTVVVVERLVRPEPGAPEVVAESRLVERVRSDDPDWEGTFTAAMELARQRAAVLEAQGDG